MPFITPEVEAAREELLRQEKLRESEMREAQVEAFLEAIEDICEDVKESVVLEYMDKGVPPFSVRVVCKELTTTVENNKQCAEALLSALQKAEEHTSSVEFEVFKSNIYNQYSQYGHSYVVVNFSWE